jgi:hypothetical protein
VAAIFLLRGVETVVSDDRVVEFLTSSTRNEQIAPRVIKKVSQFPDGFQGKLPQEMGTVLKLNSYGKYIQVSAKIRERKRAKRPVSNKIRE